jgi:hypothetical protein
MQRAWAGMVKTAGLEGEGLLRDQPIGYKQVGWPIDE